MTRHSVTPAGEVSRLSVAVILDDQTIVTTDKNGKTVRSEKPLPAGQLQKIQGLVAAAVGLDSTRGDRLTVENIAVRRDADGRRAGGADRAASSTCARSLIGAGVSLVLFMGLIGMLIVRRKKRGSRKALAVQAATHAAAGIPGQAPRTVQDMQSEIEAELDALSQAGEPRKLPVLTKRIGGMVGENPRAVAQLLRTWMAEDQR